MLEYGVNSASYELIAEKSGLSVRTLRRYFRNKVALVCDVMKNVGVERYRLMCKNILAAVDPEDSGLEQLRQVHYRMYYLYEGKRSPWLMISEIELFAYENNVPSDILAYYLRQVHTSRKYCKQILLKGIKDGSIRSDINPDAYAAQLVNTYVGMLQRMQAVRYTQTEYPLASIKEQVYLHVESVVTNLRNPDSAARPQTKAKDAQARTASAPLSDSEILRIYNSIPGAAFQCRFDRDWTVLFANNGLYDYLGYSRDEFVAMGNRMSAVIPPEDLAGMTDLITAQLDDGKTLVENENRFIRKDGQVRWIAIKAQLMRDERGEKSFYCVFVDITKQKQAEQRLRESRENLAISMDSAGIAYWVFDLQSRNAYFSAPVQNVFGIPELCENYPYGFVNQGFVAPAQRRLYIDSVNSLLEGAASSQFEAQIRTRRGEEEWVRIRLTAVADGSGKPKRAVGTAQPLRDEKKPTGRLSTFPSAERQPTPEGYRSQRALP